MPGYPKKSMYAAPEPTVEVVTVENRFVMPKVTIIQMVLIALIVGYAFSARKMNGVVVGTIALTIAFFTSTITCTVSSVAQSVLSSSPKRKSTVANRASKLY